jgi:hypothetical protein
MKNKFAHSANKSDLALHGGCLRNNKLTSTKRSGYVCLGNASGCVINE